MPNPNDYMDDKHTYVRGYVRKKHKDEDTENRVAKKDNYKVGVIYFILAMVSGVFTFADGTGFVWRVISGLVCVVFLYLMVKTIIIWWNNIRWQNIQDTSPSDLLESGLKKIIGSSEPQVDYKPKRSKRRSGKGGWF